MIDEKGLEAAEQIVPYRSGTASEGFLIGARRTGYSGPEAAVNADADWLHIVTDEYEGAVMLNVEVLPVLIEALQELIAARPQNEGE